MRQRRNPSIIDHIYRKITNNLTLAGQTSGTLSFTPTDFSLPANQPFKCTKIVVTVAQNGGLGSAMYMVDWVGEGKSSSRMHLTSMGSISRCVLNIPPFTDYSLTDAMNAIINIRMKNTAEASTLSGEYFVLVEAWFQCQPIEF